jgi:hypothetical protein
MKLTNSEATVFFALMQSSEGRPHLGWDRTDSSNARMASGIEGNEFAQILASLEQKGLYENAGDDVYVVEKVFADVAPYVHTEEEV